MMIKCKICGSEGRPVVITAREMMFGTHEEHGYYQCEDCGCLQIVQHPLNMAKYYPNNYYAHESAARKGYLYEFMRNLKTRLTLYGGTITDRFLSDMLRPPIRAMARIDKINVESRILDIGCGSGFLLKILSGIGLKNLQGVDKYIEMDIDCGNGIKVLKRDLSDIDGKWDVIMFHHSFEHIYDQHKTMSDVHRLLAPGGTCLIRTPTVSSYAWRYYGVDWVQLDAPRHLFLHSTKSIAMLASSAGFYVSKLLYDSTAFQFWGSELYKKRVPLVSTDRDSVRTRDMYFTKAEIRQYARRAKQLNRCNDGDQVVFYLRAV